MPWWGAGMDVLLGIPVLFLFIALPWQWAAVYLTPSRPSTAEPNTGAVVAYWIVAAVLLATLAFGFVVAVEQQRLAGIAAYAVLAAFAVVVIVVLAVPTILASRPDPVHTVNPYSCTRTDSENCPGG